MIIENELKKYKEKARLFHKNKYDYSKITNLKRLTIKVDIICKEHGIFTQNFYRHLKGYACNKCSSKQRGLKK